MKLLWKQLDHNYSITYYMFLIAFHILYLLTQFIYNEKIEKIFYLINISRNKILQNEIKIWINQRDWNWIKKMPKWKRTPSKRQ